MHCVGDQTLLVKLQKFALFVYDTSYHISVTWNKIKTSLKWLYVQKTRSFAFFMRQQIKQTLWKSLNILPSSSQKWSCESSYLAQSMKASLLWLLRGKKKLILNFLINNVNKSLWKKYNLHTAWKWILSQYIWNLRIYGATLC